MTLELGDTVWISCQVSRGVFPEDRKVTIESPTGHWVGSVDVRQLRDEILEGPTAVRATIVGASDAEYSARLPGQTTRRQYLTVAATHRSWLQQF